MNSHDLRLLFRNFAGEAEYGKFVRQIFRDLQTGHGLRFWQEKSWSAFHKMHPDVTTDPDAIRAAFAWCHVHHTPFTTLEVPNEWLSETAEGFSDAADRDFPFCYGFRLCLECVTARDRWISEHPLQKPPKPIIEWDELETRLFELARNELRMFAAEHSDETFYGFAFDCNSDHGGVLLCVNTEDDLWSCARSYKSKHPDSYRAQSVADLVEKLRWSTGDWKYQGFESSDFESEWEPFADSLMENCFGEEEDPRAFMSPTQTKVMDSICRVAIRLETSAAFDCLNQTGHFTIFVADHDESDERSWARLNAMRDELNGA